MSVCLPVNHCELTGSLCLSEQTLTVAKTQVIRGQKGGKHQQYDKENSAWEEPIPEPE